MVGPQTSKRCGSNVKLVLALILLSSGCAGASQNILPLWGQTLLATRGVYEAFCQPMPETPARIEACEKLMKTYNEAEKIYTPINEELGTE